LTAGRFGFGVSGVPTRAAIQAGRPARSVALSAAVYAALRIPAIAAWRSPSRPHMEEGEPVLTSAGATTLR